MSCNVCLDNDEKKWVKKLLLKKQQSDFCVIGGLFLKHYSILLDDTIRKHYYQLCFKCQAKEGSDHHMCEDQTASVFMGSGSKILDFTTKAERQATWSIFLEEIHRRGLFKRAIINWLKQFTSVREEIDKAWDPFYYFMLRHFPNPTKNPHQEYLDYEDYDDID